MEKMKYLTAKEVAQLLGIPMVTVLRWAHQGKIPCWLKEDGYEFKQHDILTWASTHNFMLAKKEAISPDTLPEESVSLTKALERGGFFYNQAGNDIYSVLKNAVDIIPLPAGTDKEKVLNELLNREEIASTGIGKGVAIPHPRIMLKLDLDAPVIFVVFLEKDVDFNAVDGLGVFVLFLIFSPSTHLHLKLLSQLSLCLREETFLTLLKKKSEKNILLSAIQTIENQFDATPVL